MSASDVAVERIARPAWVDDAGTRAVLAALEAEGGTARFVGGCVRDTLLGRPIGDIDIATPLTPDRVLARLKAAGIKAVPTGLVHGTVTAVTPQRHLEITTLRRDVETDGRHARVAFTADWAADAARRDFTMNALYLDAGGNLFDPMGGLADLRAGRVRFVGDAATRIREDVLRLLRFYRFHAQLGRGTADPTARAACHALAALLPSLSGERIAAETLKLLAAADPIPTLALMAEDGVLAAFLPEARHINRLAALVAFKAAGDPLRRLAALLAGDGVTASAVADRLRLSGDDRLRLVALLAPPWPVDLASDDRAQRRALYRLGPVLYRDLVLLRAAETGAGGRVAALLALADTWPLPQFPLKGRDVTALGVPPGPAIGRLLADVETWWEEGDFSAARDACLGELARRARG